MEKQEDGDSYQEEGYEGKGGVKVALKTGVT
jgi:hypothetical protein